MTAADPVPADDLRAMLARHLGQVITIVRAEPARLGNARLVTIDGPAGAGKTTVASVLAELADDVALVHLDDLYQGWSGLNDALFERIQAELIQPLRDSQPATITTWDWQLDRPGTPITVEPAPIIILEGVGASDATIRPWCTQQLWVELDVALAAARGLERDLAAANAAQSVTIRQGWATWRAHQDAYMATSDNREIADLTLAMSPHSP